MSRSGGVHVATRSVPPPLEITYLGRSTVLVGLDGVRILTDPYLPAPLLSWSRRVAAPEPPHVDAVVVSHGHLRHMNLATLRRLPGTPRILAPSRDAENLRRAGVWGVEAVEPGDVVSVAGVAIQAIAAAHGTLHAALPPRHDPIGYVIEGSSSVYFAGDSLPRELGTPVDVALIPVAPALRYVGHLSPSDAAASAALARPRLVGPIHWAAPALDELAPAWLPRREVFTQRRLEAELTRALEARGIEVELRVLEPGYSTTVEPSAAPTRLSLARAVPRSDARSALEEGSASAG